MNPIRVHTTPTTSKSMTPLPRTNSPIIHRLTMLALAVATLSISVGATGCTDHTRTRPAPSASAPDTLPPLPPPARPPVQITVSTTPANVIRDFTVRDASGQAIIIPVQAAPIDPDMDRVRRENAAQQIRSFIPKMFPDRHLTAAETAAVAEIYLRFAQGTSAPDDASVFHRLLGVTQLEFGALSLSSELSLDSRDVVVQREHVLQRIRERNKSTEK